jgi:hypothetical protein
VEKLARPNCTQLCKEGLLKPFMKPLQMISRSTASIYECADHKSAANVVMHTCPNHVEEEEEKKKKKGTAQWP